MNEPRRLNEGLSTRKRDKGPLQRTVLAATAAANLLSGAAPVAAQSVKLDAQAAEQPIESGNEIIDKRIIPDAQMKATFGKMRQLSERPDEQRFGEFLKLGQGVANFFWSEARDIRIDSE